MKKYDLKINGKEYNVDIKDFSATNAKVEVNGKPYDVEIKYQENETPVVIPKITRKSAPVQTQQAAAPAQAPATATAGSSINAPMPGLILKLLVKVGDTVATGQKIAVMEAMKMENDINTQFAGTVSAINIKEGDNVQENQSLVVIS